MVGILYQCTWLGIGAVDNNIMPGNAFVCGSCFLRRGHMGQRGALSFVKRDLEGSLAESGTACFEAECGIIGISFLDPWICLVIVSA